MSKLGNECKPAISVPWRGSQFQIDQPAELLLGGSSPVKT